MKLLMLSQFFPPDIGGEERHVLNLSTVLAGRGHDVAVATQAVFGLPEHEVLPSGVRVHRFPTAAMQLPGVYSSERQHHPPLPDPVGVRHLARILRDERPDVVHAHNWIVNTALPLRTAVATGRGDRLGVPDHRLVLTLHDYSQVCATKRMMRDGAICAGPAPQRCLPCATAHYGPVVGVGTAAATSAMRPWKRHGLDHTVCVSRSVADRNGVWGRPDVSVIPNFIPDALADPGTGDAAVPGGPAEPVTALPAQVADLPEGDYILFVGDLSGEKGVHVLLRAYDALPHPRPHLVLVGRRGEDTPERLPEGARILLNWPHDAVLEAFRRCLFAVLPSVWPDPCPTTVLEGMSQRRPVITTSIGGMVDMVVTEESGLLVAPGDDAALEAAMRRLLDDPALRERLSAGATDRVRQFSATSVAERLEGVYAQVRSRT